MTSALSAVDRHSLLDLLDRRLALEEVRQLAFAVNLDWDNLPGETKRDKVMALLDHCERRRIPPRLMAAIADARPDLGLTADTLYTGSRRPTIPTECPYRGLFAFREEDAKNFFGREMFINSLAEAVQARPLVALVGASGSGKSSILYAGLVPRWRHTQRPAIAAFRPGAHPFRSLAAALLPLLDPALSETDRLLEVPRLADALVRGDVALLDVTRRIADRNPDLLRPLLIADQFEELFTLCNDEALRRPFIHTLLSVIRLGPPRALALVLALRADFFGDALSHRPLADALQGATLHLGPMTGPELLTTIETPALNQGVLFEEGLTERILGDVHGEPGNLPLLQFALTELWHEQRLGLITHAAYDRIGGVKRALTVHADKVLARLGEDDKALARRVFTQLVRPGEGVADTRRIATRADLGETGWALAATLAGPEARVVVTGRDEASGVETVEVVHEALIQGWDRLREWMNEDRAFRVWQEDLRSDLRQWLTNNEDEGALLRGVPLAIAEDWLHRRGEDLSLNERTFVESSLNLRERERRAAEEDQATRERQRRRITQAALGAALVFLLLAGVAFWQWGRAEEQMNTALIARQEAEQRRQEADTERRRAETQLQIAESRRLAAQARTIFETELDLGLLLSLAARQAADTVEARANLIDGLRVSPPLAAYLRGNMGTVYGVAFSPDGQTLASGNDADTVILWDVATRQRLGEQLKGHTSWVNSVAFSPDGRTLASASADRTVMLWDGASRQRLGEPFRGHVGGVNSVAFSPDGQTLASGSDDDTIILWDVASRQPLGEPLKGHENNVNCVAFSPDGQLLASAGLDNTVILWDVATRQPLGEPLKGHTSWVNSVAFSPDGRTLASASDDNTISLWVVASRQPLGQPLEGHTDGVWSVAFSPDGRTLASGSGDNTVILWDVASHQPLGQRLQGHLYPVLDIAFSPDGRFLASGSNDKTVILWDVANRQPLGEMLKGHRSFVTSIAVSPDGRTLASGSNDNTVILWDIATRQPVEEPLRGHSAEVTSVAVSPDGRTLASGSRDRTVILWDVTTHQPVAEPLRGHSAEVTSVAFSPDGQVLASGSRDRTIYLWETRTHRPLGQPLQGRQEGLNSLAFSPDGQVLASASDDNAIILWDVQTGQRSGEPLKGHTAEVTSVAFSPDGKMLVSGSVNSVIILWDVASRQPLSEPLEGHAAGVTSVTFTPDGKMIASGGHDDTVLLWDVSTRQRLGEAFKGHTDSVRSVTFTADGRSLASASHDGTILLWDVDPASWERRACGIVNRNLTQEEWRRYLYDAPYRKVCPDQP